MTKPCSPVSDDVAVPLPFAVGDVVRLKCNLALMVVEYVNPPDEPGGLFVSCGWLDRKGCLQRSQFVPATLVLAP